MVLRDDADRIIDAALKAASPDAAVGRALNNLPAYGGKLHLLAIGKAAWQMAYAAYQALGERIYQGFVVTKHGHSMGDISKNIRIYEADHPIPGDFSFIATQAVIDAAVGFEANDLVLFLISGGGSALFEKPICPLEDLIDITNQLMACGADIVEMNIIRKRLSAVKAGRFAQICYPAEIYSVVLSDILGDPLDMIASGPAHSDASSCEDAFSIEEKYNLSISDKIKSFLSKETPKQLGNVKTAIVGNVRLLCDSAMETARKLGYEPIFLTDGLDCEAREVGSLLASIARTHQGAGLSLAFILGGETVVRLTGKGKGGRNQEIALSAAVGIDGLENVAIFSVGSDGTDGPTDAAGGYVDGESVNRMKQQGVDPVEYLRNNDAYHALLACEGLIVTGPTGTNVNDFTILLVK